jgi:hypothetical protein
MLAGLCDHRRGEDDWVARLCGPILSRRHHRVRSLLALTTFAQTCADGQSSILWLRLRRTKARRSTSTLQKRAPSPSRPSGGSAYLAVKSRSYFVQIDLHFGREEDSESHHDLVRVHDGVCAQGGCPSSGHYNLTQTVPSSSRAWRAPTLWKTSKKPTCSST